MRVGILSDIHGNIRGLDACLRDLEMQGGADVIVAAGDLCMDGPRPRQVLERLASIGARCVRGNTDRYIGDADVSLGDADEARRVEWQRKAIGEAWTAWLRALPFSVRIGDGPEALLVVHANPKSDDEYIWPDSDDAFLEQITDGVVERTIAFGHLHIPYARIWRDRLFVNVASAGLPKDGDPRACYAILMQRSGGWEVKHRRVEFDVEKVARDIEKSGMPGAKKRVAVLRRHRYKDLGARIP